MKDSLLRELFPAYRPQSVTCIIVTWQPAELFPAKSPQAECCLLLHVDRTGSDRGMTLPARLSTQNSKAFDLGELKKKL